MATATKAVTSFMVACPTCGTTDEGALSIDLDNFRAITCHVCGDVFSPEQAVEKARVQLERWLAVGRWVALAGQCLSGENV